MATDEPAWDAGHSRQGTAGSPYRLPAPCQPRACSYDPADEANAALHERMLAEPGRQPRRGESACLHAVAWLCAPYGFPDPQKGWRDITAALTLLACDGTLYRFFGWDAITDFCALIMGVDPVDSAQGIDVVIRSAESPAGDHWWWVIERGGP